MGPGLEQQDRFAQNPGRYVWNTRLFTQMGTNRAVFSCPSAKPKAWWDTNVNKTLGVAGDPFAVRFTSFFSTGYNDWGAHGAFVNHGLGGDVDTLSYEISESAVKNPHVTAIASIPAARPARMSNGASPT